MLTSRKRKREIEGERGGEKEKEKREKERERGRKTIERERGRKRGKEGERVPVPRFHNLVPQAVIAESNTGQKPHLGNLFNSEGLED